LADSSRQTAWQGQSVVVCALGSGTAGEWPHILRGVSYVTGIESRGVPQATEASDQQSFIERGVPGIQLFTGAHADYHRPEDTADRIDAAGLVKVATFAKEVVAHLTERPEPLTVAIAGPGTTATTAAPLEPSAPRRRVSFGLVPDFGFAGPGVRAASVVPGSPTEAAGLKDGDVLLLVEQTRIESLAGFSEVLRTLAPGQTVQVVVGRGGDEIHLSVTLAAR